jgi:VID27 C-terminal WD40-like domain/VID27 N-terminal region/VID27 PH-like domain
MFLIKSVTKALFSDTSKEKIIDIPQGQLFIVRPLSPKGYSELIFKDAVASIRRTGQDYQYQLVIQRAYEEGEDDADEEEDLDNLDKDEKTFLLDETLHFRMETREGGENVLAWRDLSGDAGDLYEFVCDPSIQADKVTTFLVAAIESQFERKYRKSARTATEEQLREFQFDQDDEIPAAEPTQTAIEQGPTSEESAARMAKDVKSSKKANSAVVRSGIPTVAPTARIAPAKGEVLTRLPAELHLFDFESGTFILQDPAVIATVSDLGGWQYWLQIDGTEKEWLGQPIIADINPVFNFEFLSFIFNNYTEDGAAYSWLLRFKDQETIEDFQEGLMRSLWEQLHETKWGKVTESDREYVFEAFNDLTMDDAPQEEDEDEEESDDEEEDASKPRSEHYDTDESEDNVELTDKDGNVNSQLAVGTSNDRSYVIRGSKIGVFKHDPNGHLEFSTNISQVRDQKGKLFSPKKVMLHLQDKGMILQDEANPNSLYQMDLSKAQIVSEWKVGDDIQVTSFAPTSKFAQTTIHEDFVAHSKNAIFKVDPRLAGKQAFGANALNDKEMKQYAGKMGFSAMTTTEKGHIAVASDKGDIRLFDRLGVIAKTSIPALGEAIIGIDVSADGRWVLATCKTYLLLVDAQQKEGQKHAGKLGFEKSFAKDEKPQPRRLGLTPSHVAQFQHETKAPLSFTPAKFNTGENQKETSIITSTGPFVVTWSMKKVLANHKDPYYIRRYSDEVISDNFEFGSDQNVILAMPNEVDMVKRKTFKRPTRESIAGPTRLSSGSNMRTPRKTRASGLRDEIVNSPY